ncbi:hypothetical protein ACIHEI_34145 [Kitasatospora sp. NPDC051984]|uniref:hypothetical protein n=1 Tax=Kitasatospora sp. NPDC051984 TaxID=3364059 RepID=UPI0037C93405
MTETALPQADLVGRRAAEILTRIEADPEFPAFEAATLEYSSDWQCFTGFPTIERWNLDADKGPLLAEGLCALALKAAVFELTGDERAAEVALPVPVDEMTHAMIAQPQLLARIAERTGFTLIHQTDQEHTDYTSGGYTHAAYRAAWNAEPPTRYWLDKAEVDRRLAILAAKYDSIGMGRSGREHSIDFAAA